MAKVTFILGLSGSGKTYLAQKIKTETGAKVFENILEDGSSLVVLIECLKERLPHRRSSVLFAFLS
jgi:RecA-family ATPase